MTHRFRNLLLLTLVGPVMALAAPNIVEAFQETEANPEEEAIRAELVELRDRMFAAYESRDLETMLKDIGSEIIITWQNGDRNHGPKAFTEFFNKMMKGDNALVVDVKTEFELDGSAILYGDSAAVASGTTTDVFKLRDGRDFSLDSKWTASLSKVEGQWKITSYHVSSNVFDNPFLSTAKQWLVIMAVIGAICGLILGAVLMRLFTAKPKASQ